MLYQILVRLPVCQQNNNAKGPSKWQLVFMQSAQRTEFWSALLEKAYAKLAGSYEALIGGLSSEAMEDFTGGITVSYAPRQVPCPRVLFHTILEANKRSCLMNCSVVKMKTQDALLYCESFVTEDGKPTDEPPGDTVFVPLVRIRNPWGSSREWSGDWGDKSKAWAAVSAEEKARINVKFKGDGEFWMSIKDFCKFFSDLEMCHLGPESLAHARRQAGKLNDKRRCWESVSHKSAWRKRLSAGGCRNNLRSFASNPQFQVTVVDPDETDNDNTGTVIVGLMQINLRRRRAAGDRMLFIGYEIYRRRTDGTGPLDTNFFRYNRCAGFTTHTNKRQIPMEPSAQELTLERALRDAFAKVAGADLEVDAYELRDILNIAFMKEFKFDGFCLETCRSMVAMMDADQSGKLGFQEFKTLWSSLRLWKTAFKKFDEDKSGNFNSYELRQALKTVGYRVSNKIFNCLVMRYANRQGVIEFDDFIVCCVRLKTVFETFSAQEKTADGVSALFSKDKFLSAAAYV
uniref:Calpain-3 n=1 Tax=Macrostomum lignano TaxID=282301 RepID=A0A1I8GE46_9PLAT